MGRGIQIKKCIRCGKVYKINFDKGWSRNKGICHKCFLEWSCIKIIETLRRIEKEVRKIAAGID